MVFACFVVLGTISGFLLPLEYFPDITEPFLSVNIPYPGSTPEEMEEEITRPAEEVLATTSGIKRMESDSFENRSEIRLEFDWGVDVDVKALEAREKLEGIRKELPSDVERFGVFKWSASDMEMLALRLSSSRDLSNAYDMLERNLKRRIERIDGVSRVVLYGVEKKEIRIELLADRIIAHRIDLSRLARTLSRSNFLVTAGKITDSGERFIVRPVGELSSIEEVGDLLAGDGNIRLRDIAHIAYDHPELDYGRHLDRRYAVGLDVFKEAGANTVEVTRRIMEEIEEIGKLPEMEGIRIFYMENLAEGITSSLDELLKSGIFGGLLAVFVLYFFLRRFSTTLLVALMVPSSLVVTLACMYFMGISLNILSMMGLMLAVGMLVDNSVVVIESIHRHQLEGEPPVRSVTRGVREVALAVTAGTCTTVIVFLPNIMSTNNNISMYLKHVAITITIALGASLLLAQTVVPLLASRLAPPRGERKRTIIDSLLDRYSGALGWTLSHRPATTLLMLLVLASVAVPVSFVKTNMFDEPGDRRLRLHYHIDGSYTLEKVEEAVNIFEAYLYDHKEEFEIESVYSYFQGDFASSTILLTKGKAAKKSMDEIREAIRKGLPKVAIADPSFEWRSRSGEGESVEIQLVGTSSEELARLSQEVAWSLSRIPGLVDVRSEANLGKEEVRVVVDRTRARQYGSSTQEIANVVAAAMRGVNLRRFRTPDGEIEMRLVFQESDRRTLEQLADLPLFRDNGDRPVTLASLADFRIGRGPQSIHRENRSTSLGVTANLRDITVEEARAKIGKVLESFAFPPGYSWNYGRQFDEEEEAFRTMLTNLLMALALIYFVMASLFESIVFPAAIWTQILFAVVGVEWFFLATGTTMSIMGMIGILVLIGVVVNNGIVLVDRVNQLRASGMDRSAAILQAGRDRLRPILMTAGTTILSLLPLSIVTTQIGGEGPPYFPMARAIVGGLAFSTVVTLLFLPTIYLLLDDLRSWAKDIVRSSMRH